MLEFLQAFKDKKSEIFSVPCRLHSKLAPGLDLVDTVSIPSSCSIFQVQKNINFEVLNELFVVTGSSRKTRFIFQAF